MEHTDAMKDVKDKNKFFGPITLRKDCFLTKT